MSTSDQRIGRRPTGRGWLVLPVVVLFAADVGFTLCGQPPSYWAGDRTTVNEINPVGNSLLAIHPWAFVGVAAVWLVSVSVVVLVWRGRWVVWGAKVLSVGHALGGACWLAQRGGWWLAVGGGYLVLAAVFANWCWRRVT